MTEANLECLKLDPMFDTTSKVALQYDLKFSECLLNAFLGLSWNRLKGLSLSDANFLGLTYGEYKNGYKEIPMSADNLFKLGDGTQIIVEIQREKQDFFLQRLWVYGVKAISKQFDNIRVGNGVHDQYSHVKPVYVVGIAKGKYVEDNIVCRELDNGFSIPLGKEQVSTPMIRIILVEIDKYDGGIFDNDAQKILCEFFLRKPYSSENIPAVVKIADKRLSNSENWEEEEKVNWYKEQALLREGRAEAKAEAEAEAKEKALEAAKEMIIDEVLDKNIVKYTKLPLEEIIKLRSELTLSGTL